MDRERLTITLNKDVLRRLDAMIDGITLRNRSHAIESFLEKTLGPQVNQAVILAGGNGVKTKPLTYEMPKALIPVRGKPMLEYQIKLLRDNNINTIIIAIGHLGEKIKSHFGDGSRFGVSISYSEESKPLGTAGALRSALSKLASETMIVLHGDILAEIDLIEMSAFHTDQHLLGTIALSTATDTSSFGTVKLRGSKIMDFVEKPGKGETRSLLVNSGIYILEPEIFDYIPLSKSVMLEDIFPKLAKEGKLAGFPFEGLWFDISTPKTYEQAIKSWGK